MAESAVERAKQFLEKQPARKATQEKETGTQPSATERAQEFLRQQQDQESRQQQIQSQQQPSRLRPTAEQAFGAGGTGAGALEAGQEFVATPTVEDIAQQFNIGTEGVSPEARNLINRIPEFDNQLNLIAQAIEQTEEIPIEDVRVGPQTGQLEFRRRGSDRYTLVNRPGFDLGDLQAAEPAVTQFLQEIAGGAGGAAVGGLSGNPALAGLGATIGESAVAATVAYNRLRKLQEKGFPISDQQVIREAFTAGGFAALGGTAGQVGFALFRSMAGRLPTTLTRFANKEIEESIGSAEQTAAQSDIPFSVGQATRSQEPELFAAEQFLSGQQPGKGLRDIFQQQDIQLRQQLEGAGPQASRSERMGAQDFLRRKAGLDVLGRARKEAEQAEAAAQQAMLDVTRPALPQAEAGAATREALSRAKEQRLQPLQKQFNRLTAPESEAGQAPIDLTKFRDRMLEVRSKLDKSLFPSLQKENRKLVREASEAGKRTDEDEVLPEGLEIDDIAEDEPVPLWVVQRDLSNLRDEMSKPAERMTPKQRQVITEMHDELRRARNESLPDDLLKDVLKIEEQYRTAKAEFERTIIGNLLGRGERGMFKVPDERVIQNIMSTQDGSNARTLSRILRGDENGDIALNNIRRGLLDFYASETGAKEGLPNPVKHRQFFERHRESLRALLPKKEFEDMQNIGRAFRKFNDARLRQKNFEKAIPGNLAPFLSKTEGNIVAEKLYTKNQQSNLRKARRFLKRWPDKLNAFDAEIARLTKNVIANENDPQTGLPIPTTQGIDDFFKEEWRVDIAREAFGRQYLKTLRDLREGLALADKTPTVKDTELIQRMSGQDSLIGMSRFLRVPFAPLTARGRALSATVSVMRRETARRVSELLADPKKFKELSQLRRARMFSEPAATAFGQLGMHSLALFATRPEVIKEPSTEGGE